MNLNLADLGNCFRGILVVSGQASILALIIFGLQWLLRKKINATWRYAFWSVVLLRLVFPSLPVSPLSLERVASTPVVQRMLISSEISGDSLLQESPRSANPEPILQKSGVHISPTLFRSQSIFSFLGLVWLVGAVVLLVRSAWAQIKLLQRVRQSSTVIDEEVLVLVQSVQRQLRLKHKLNLVEDSWVTSPAITGLFRPTLILPLQMLGEFTFDEFRLILLHELAHLKRGDIFMLYLTTFLQKVHWFNPILWLAFQRANQDRELATDELVLRETMGIEKESYGLTLLKFVERANPPLVATSSLGMADHSGDFSLRLKNIAAFSSVRNAWFYLAPVLLGLLVLIGLTKAETPGNVNDWDNQPRGHLVITVVDEQGKPIAGVSVKLDGLESKEEPGDNICYGDDPAFSKDFLPGLTNAAGKVTVIYPQRLVPTYIVTGAKVPFTTTTVVLSLHAASYCPEFKGFPIDHPASVVLKKGVQLTLVAEPVPGVRFSTLAVQSLAEKSTITASPDGLSVHYDNLGLRGDNKAVRLVALTPEGKIYFAAPFRVDTEKLTDHKLTKTCQMVEGRSIQGTFDPSIPRPIKNGWVYVSVQTGAWEKDNFEINWAQTASVDEKGSFTVDNLPEGRVAIAAGCDGYNSSINTRYGQITPKKISDPMIVKIPQTGKVRLQIVDQRGNPIAGAAVSFLGVTISDDYCNNCPNGFYFSSLSRLDSPETIKLPKMVDYRRADAGQTDLNGTVTFDNLPAGTNEYTVTCPKYFVDPSLAALDQDGFQTVKVKSGQESLVKVTMIPK